MCGLRWVAISAERNEDKNHRASKPYTSQQQPQAGSLRAPAQSRKLPRQTCDQEMEIDIQGVAQSIEEYHFVCPVEYLLHKPESLTLVIFEPDVHLRSRNLEQQILHQRTCPGPSLLFGKDKCLYLCRSSSFTYPLETVVIAGAI